MERERACRWYAVCCKPRQETVAEENLMRQGFEVYLPRVRITKYRRRKWANSLEALFPRYVFIRLDPLRSGTATVRSTRGVVGLVRFGEHPAVIADEVIDAILQREEAGSGFIRYGIPSFRSGEAIKLVGGPLAGLEGVFTQQDGDARVIVLLELLGKPNRISVNRDWVTQAH